MDLFRRAGRGSLLLACLLLLGLSGPSSAQIIRSDSKVRISAEAGRIDAVDLAVRVGLAEREGECQARRRAARSSGRRRPLLLVGILLAAKSGTRNAT